MTKQEKAYKQRAKMPDTLAKKLWKSTENAIRDLKKAIRSRKYEVDMSTWYMPGAGDNNGCLVCLGGSVIAFSLGDGCNELTPSNFSYKIQGKLEALDSIRCGNVCDALELHYGYSEERATFILSEAHIPYNYDVTPYAVNDTEFFNDIAKIVRILKKADL